MAEIFDDWPERYDQWFESLLGQLIRKYESKLILELLEPKDAERIENRGQSKGLMTGAFIAARWEKPAYP